MSAMQGTHPPSTGVDHTLFHHCEDVAPFKGEFICTLCSVVVQSFGNFTLKQNREFQDEDDKADTILLNNKKVTYCPKTNYSFSCQTL